MGIESAVTCEVAGFVRVFLFVLLLALSARSAPCPAKCDCSSRTPRLECRHEMLTLLPKGPFTRLEYLDLSFNRLPSLKNYMFADEMIFTIDTLILANNTISSFEEESLVGLSSLLYLDLSGNDIGYFKASVFEHTRKITTLKLDNNHGLLLPEESIELPGLTVITLNGCALTHVPDNFFKHFAALEHINLSHNKLTYFDSKQIDNLTSLKRLDLNQNKITNLHLVLYHLPKSIGLLNLLQNQWHCDCDLSQSYPLYKDTLYRQDLKCSSPKSFEYKNINRELVESIICTTTEVAELPAITTEPGGIIDLDEESGSNYEDDVEQIQDMHVESFGVVGKSADFKSFPSEPVPKEEVVDTIAQAGWIDDVKQWWWIASLCVFVIICGVTIFIIHRQVGKLRKRSPLGRSRVDLEETGYRSVNSL